MSASTAQSLFIPFSAFVDDAGNASPVDWGDIDAITFIVSGPGGAGFALDTFGTVQAVPEPASLGLLLAGLGVIGGRVYRATAARIERAT